jgi:hypothetical protein
MLVQLNRGTNAVERIGQLAQRGKRIRLLGYMTGFLIL